MTTVNQFFRGDKVNKTVDKIEITALQMNAYIGVHAWEQRILQRIVVDLSFSLDLTQCQDQLENTIDYANVCQQVTQYVESQPFRLIETLAEQVAQLLKTQFYLDSVMIRVSKPHAVKNAGNVSVTLVR